MSIAPCKTLRPADSSSASNQTNQIDDLLEMTAECFVALGEAGPTTVDVGAPAEIGVQTFTQPISCSRCRHWSTLTRPSDDGSQDLFKSLSHPQLQLKL